MTEYVDPNSFKVPYAFSAAGELFQIKDGRPHEKEIHCPICKGRVSFVRETPERAAHFRHYDRTDCDILAKGHRETMHDEVVNAAATLLNMPGGARNVIYWPSHIPMPEGQVFVETPVTVNGKTYKPDLHVAPKVGQKAPTLELEVVFSHRPERDRVMAAARAGRLIASIRTDSLMDGYYRKLWRGEAFDIPEAAKAFIKEHRFTLWSGEDMQREVSGIINRIYQEATILREHRHMRAAPRSAGDMGVPISDQQPHEPIGGYSPPRPRTWTGRVVSQEEWAMLTEWDKYGPNGRLYCGICRVWK